MLLTTLARVKAKITAKGKHDLPVEMDEVLTDMLEAYSAAAGLDVMRRHPEEIERTEDYTLAPTDRRVFLLGYPLKTGAALTVEVDGVAVSYTVNQRRGVILLEEALVERVVRVTYTGGMAPIGDPDEASNFILAFPQVSEALDVQIAADYQRLDDLGAASFSVAASSVGFVEAIQWLPRTLETLHRLRREIVS